MLENLKTDKESYTNRIQECIVLRERLYNEIENLKGAIAYIDKIESEMQPTEEIEEEEPKKKEEQHVEVPKEDWFEVTG